MQKTALKTYLKTVKNGGNLAAIILAANALKTAGQKNLVLKTAPKTAGKNTLKNSGKILRTFKNAYLVHGVEGVRTVLR